MVAALPLSHTWTLWTSKWKGKPNVQFLGQFDTIQSFWTNFHEFPATSLADKSYLHIFKEGVAPLWEDPHNVNGGHFKLTANTPESSLPMWQSIVLNMIGGQFPTDQCINGASIVVHHGVGNNLIKVWLSTSDKETVARTKVFLASILDPEAYITDKVTFVPHKLVLPSTNQRSPAKEDSQVASPLVSEESKEAVNDQLLSAFPTKKGQKRRKSRDLTVQAQASKKASFRRASIALATMTTPVCCGPADVRFAHDPYSLTGGCTYLPLQSAATFQGN